MTTAEPDDVEQAVALGRPTLTRLELAERTGTDPERSQRFWRAMGFPDLPDDEVALTEIDAGIVERLTGLLASGAAGDEVALQMTRVLGQSLSRAAEAHIETVIRQAEQFDPADAQARRSIVLGAVELVEPLMEEFLVYLWRRHLAAAARRALVSIGDADGGELAVGFADLVGFTAWSQQLDEVEIAAMVARFESLTHDAVVDGGGRVVKMIGDEVLFVCADPTAAITIALAIAGQCALDSSIPDVRVGLAWGRTVPREGDHFGPTVNLASRLVRIAYPGSVLVSDEMRSAASALDDAIRWKRVRAQTLKGLGRVPVWVAEPVSPPLVALPE